MVANAQDFFQRGDSLKCFLDTIFQQGAHAVAAGDPADLLGRLAIEGHLANGGGHLEHLEDTQPAAVARIVAVVAVREN